MSKLPTILGLQITRAHAVAAALDGDGVARVVPNAEGADATEAALHFYDADGAVVGAEAVEAAFTEPDATSLDVFDALGESTEPVTLVGRAWTPQELAALVLRKVRDDAVVLRGPVRGAMIALPATADSARRSALAEASALAHLDVLDVIPSSTAAVIGWGIDRLPDPARVVVVDVGELGVDVAVLRRLGDELREEASLSSSTLGVRAWVNTLLDQALHQVPHPPELAQIIRASGNRSVREVLARLALHPNAVLAIGSGEARQQLPLAREQVVRQAWSLCVRVGRLARGALLETMSRDVPDAVLLVGAGAQLPGLRRALGVALETRVVPDPLPHTTVARGAAWLGASRFQPEHPGLVAVPKAPPVDEAPLPEPGAPVASTLDDAVPRRAASFTLADGGAAPAPRRREVRVTERAATTLGVLAMDERGNERVVPLIPAGTELPATVHGRFHYAYDNMTAITVEVTEGPGERRDGVKVVGEVRLKRLPPRPRGTPIQITWTFGADRVLKVEVTDVETGALSRADLSFRGGLSDAEKAVARARAGRLNVG